MNLMVKPTAGCARVGDRYVFLDLEADRYITVHRQASHAVERMAAGKAATQDDLACLAPLLRTGLLVEASSSRSWPTHMASPDKEWHGSHPQKAWSLDILRVLWATGRARRVLNDRPISDVLTRFAKVKADWRPPREDIAGMVERLVSAFLVSRALVPTLDQCLPRSLALATLLAKRGIAVRLCFGVAMPPFAAHCWVEHDGVLLGDSVDVVRNFVPILRI